MSGCLSHPWGGFSVSPLSDQVKSKVPFCSFAHKAKGQKDYGWNWRGLGSLVLGFPQCLTSIRTPLGYNTYLTPQGPSCCLCVP